MRDDKGEEELLDEFLAKSPRPLNWRLNKEKRLAKIGLAVVLANFFCVSFLFFADEDVTYDDVGGLIIMVLLFLMGTTLASVILAAFVSFVPSTFKSYKERFTESVLTVFVILQSLFFVCIFPYVLGFDTFEFIDRLLD